MNYQEFLTTIRTQLSLRIETGVTLDIRSFTKNNGTHYDGLVLLHPKKNVSPAIYLMPYYHRYLEGVCLEEICEDILHTYQAHAPEENFDTSYFTDFSRASEHIVMRLVSFEKNQELLKEVPFFRYQDLAVIFYCLLHASAENQANILIHNHHLNLWKTDKETLDRLLDTLGMKERRSHLPSQLSGGQQQRCAIGRVLFTNPALMLADEPTGNLDSKSAAEVMELLGSANKQYGQTLIMITHNLELAKLADRMLIIKDGKLSEG